MDFGFPELTEPFLSGQDIFYRQFNDIDFYVEDVDQEHFYFNVLKRLFPDLSFEKIFPLGGKGNVEKAAEASLNDKRRIYVVDLDFDGVFDSKKDFPNLFYLQRYSIENYLLSKAGIVELIREKDPKLKNDEIEAMFDYDIEIVRCCKYLWELAASFILIQKFSLGENYYGLNPGRDLDFTNSKARYKNRFIRDFFDRIEILLKTVDKRYTLHGQVSNLQIHFNSLEGALASIPGKYLLNVLKHLLERKSLINQVSLESFAYKLSKETEFDELAYLRRSVISYIASFN